MQINRSDFTASWKRVLTLSNLKPGEVVTILTASYSDELTFSCAAEAAVQLGAKVSRLDVSDAMSSGIGLSTDKFGYVGDTPLAGNSAAMAALTASDLVIDLMVLLFSQEQLEILKSGTRMLLASEPPEILMRLEPRLEDRVTVLAAGAILAKGREMTVTSRAGSDLRCQLGQYPVVKEYGFVDKPGRWDHWPSGFHATWPNEGTAQGKLVLDRGDILLPQKCYVRDPIELTIKDGYITKVEGGLDAELFSAFIDSFDDPDGYAISHIGWGLNRRAQWSALALNDTHRTTGMDARSFAGNFLFSTGPNTEVGGDRDAACHMDIPMRNCTVAVDGVEYVREGNLVEMAELADAVE